MIYKRTTSVLPLVIEGNSVDGYTGKIDLFPGCTSEGSTLLELKRNMQEALNVWLETHYDKITEEDNNGIIPLFMEIW